MVNILIPAMGKSTFFTDSFFPKQLIEIKGRTMLEMVIDNYACIDSKNYIFIFDDKECSEFHLDSSVKILSPPLIIANSDQIIDADYQSVLRYFLDKNADAGIITFPSIHPRWSYARKKGEEVVEVAEKRPLSKDAIAGFYYYAKGSDFVEGAQKAIFKNNCLKGRFYISASINEMILAGKKVVYYDIPKEKYHSFYSTEKIKENEEERYL